MANNNDSKHTTTYWKQLLADELHDFLYFFIPKLARIIDYTHAPVFLDTPANVLELNPERPQHNLLLQVLNKDQEKILLLLTLEYGGYDNRKFEQQLFRDLTATLESVDYALPVVSFVLFLANSIPASINGYEYEMLDTQIRMNQPNYAVREQYFDDLWEFKNPMTFVVASSRMAIETKEHPSIRLEKKKELLQRLLSRFERGQIQRDTLLHILEFVAHLLPLDSKHEAQFQIELINTLYDHTGIETADKTSIIQAMNE